jgi:hypothetical protein
VVETKFRIDLVHELEDLFDGCIILLGNSSYIQGIPDILILWRDRWAALECKDRRTARKEPNQQYYVNKMNEMSFAAFVYPENKDDVLNDLQHAFRPSRTSRFPRCQ